MSDELTLSDFTAATPPPTCDVCQRVMGTEIIGSIVGMQIEVSATDESFNAELRKVYPELSFPLDVKICYVCWLKSLGVKL